MRNLWCVLLLSWTLLCPAAAAETSLASALSHMPGCAADCFHAALNNSPCQGTNTTCVCMNEQLQNEATECIVRTCSMKESLTTKNLTMTTCGVPVRDAQGSYVAVSNTLAALIGICVLQRMGSKLFWKLDIAMDDWIIFFTTLLLTTPSLVINIHGLVANGMGHDIWTVPFDQITRFGNFFHVMATLYFMQMAMIKLTLLVFYLRIFPTPLIRRLLWGTIIFTCLYGTVFMFTAIFQCIPLSYFGTKWDGEHEGKCASINAITWSNAGISIALDTWMLAIPLSQLKSLKLDWKKKAGVGMMFCVGTLFTVFSIIRLHVLVKFGHTQNPTWDYLQVCKWSTIEIAVGVICVCMPSFRLLLMRLFPGLFSGDRSYANYGSNGGVAQSRSKGRPLGSVVTLQKGEPPSANGAMGITFSRSYAVELSDKEENDEIHLVDVKTHNKGNPA